MKFVPSIPMLEHGNGLVMKKISEVDIECKAWQLPRLSNIAQTGPQV